jgi:multidrug efflux pump subunit AcrB
MSRFFLDRPVFAWVIALLIMLAGILSIPQMPVEQYPTLAPPQISVGTFYPGASADTVQNSVTQVIEQQLTGIDNMRYFKSSSDATGKVEIIVTLEPGTDPDIAQVQVQNKVQTAMPLLPAAVQAQGVVVEKASTSYLFVTSFYSTNPEIGQTYLADLVASRIQDPVSRVKGVGSVSTFGSPYAMRVWLNPEKLYAYNMSTNEVLHAISEQNIDVSAGQFGALPAVSGQQINATILAQSRLKNVDQFQDIILRVNEDGSQVRLKDVANISLGEESYGTVVKRNGAPAAAFGVSLATGANALDTAKRVKDKLAELSQYLPDGVGYSFPYDTTPFVKISIESVVHTLFEAIILVFFVMLLFLQNFRATLIPTLAVPVVLLGTFATLHLFGFTINTLTMFAMVLAIGLLVDDAIVVVENVERVVPQYKIEIDMEKARALGLSIGEINATLQTAWGSAYVNDFMDNGRVKKVYVQGQSKDRMQPSDIEKWYVKNGSGKMVPFTSFTTGHWTYGSPRLERFNGYSSINIQGGNAPGVSTGEAMAEMEKLADELPEGIGYAWSTTSYEEKIAGSQGPALYAISIIIVFLSLAALYESWAIPFSVLLALPLGVVGSVIATLAFGMSNDVYFQVALLTTVGLCAKNAILIVEFAKELYESGTPLVEAALTSFKLRFRPIIMTSMAFVLGVLPLAKSTGAGAASQNAIGIAIIGGMIGATFLAIYFVPLFFVLIERISSLKTKNKKALEPSNSEVM